MKITHLEILAPSKPGRLAEVVLELSDGEGGQILLRDMRLIENREGRIWLAMPSRALKDPNHPSQFTYSDIVRIAPRSLLREIEDAALDAYEQWRLRAGSEPAEARSARQTQGGAA